MVCFRTANNKLYEEYGYFCVTAAENLAVTDLSSKLPWNYYGDRWFVYIAVDVSLVLHSKHIGGITSFLSLSCSVSITYFFKLMWILPEYV